MGYHTCDRTFVCGVYLQGVNDVACLVIEQSQMRRLKADSEQSIVSWQPAPTGRLRSCAFDLELVLLHWLVLFVK